MFSRATLSRPSSRRSTGDWPTKLKQTCWQNEIFEVDKVDRRDIYLDFSYKFPRWPIDNKKKIYVYVLNGMPNGRYNLPATGRWALPAMVYIGLAGIAYNLWGGSEWGQYARSAVRIWARPIWQSFFNPIGHSRTRATKKIPHAQKTVELFTL